MADSTPGRLVGIVAGGAGSDPFHPRSWSGGAAPFFLALKARGALHRAFGVRLPRARRLLGLARVANPQPRTWTARLNLHPATRAALTRQVARALEPDDAAHGLLQIGAYVDGPAVAAPGQPCFSYSDGNLACRLASGHPLPGLSARLIDKALAEEVAVARGMTRVFTMTEYLRRSFIDDYGVPADRVVTIGGGVVLDPPPAEQPEKDYGRQDILFIGIDFVRKGGPLLLEAFRVVRQRHPGATLHIVGPQRLEVPPHLRAGVHHHGFLPKSDPRFGALLARCTVFTMPSVYEPFGYAPIEAMAHQMPAVVTDAWGLRETVAHNRTGRLVTPGSAEDLAHHLSDLLGDPAEAARLGLAARRAALGHTWDAVAGRLLAALPGTAASAA